MMNTRLRLIELGLLAALGLTQATGVAAADPADTNQVSQRDRDVEYIYFHDDHTSMSGDTKDIARAERLRNGKEPLLWFRDGGQEYVVRDPDTLARFAATWKPINDLGDAQGKIGTQMGKLGARQGVYGAQHGLVGTRQGAIAVREAGLAAREASDSLSAADKADIARRRADLRQQMRALDQQMRALDQPMKELNDQMSVLSQKMEVLSQKMQVASRKAEAEIRTEMRAAIASGLAKPVK